MKTIVVYNSKTGFTQKYGEWIAQELGCEAVSQKKALKQLDIYDCIIFGGGIMGGRINGINKIKRNTVWKDKKMVVFATGATPQADAILVSGFKNGNLTAEEQERIPFFYFQSGMNFEKMGFFSRTIIGILKKSIMKKENKTAEDEGMLKTLEKSSDISEPTFISPLVAYVKGI